VAAVFGVGYGVNGTGTVTVSRGGVLNIGNGGGRTFIGGGPQGGPYGNGTLTITDGGVVNVGGAGINPNNDLWFNGYGTTGPSVLNLEQGGLLSTARVLANGSGTSSIINFNGGVLQITTNSAGFIVVNAARVRDGGVKIDTMLNSVTIGQALLHSPLEGDAAIDGGLTKTGWGTLTLTSNAGSFSGDVLVREGTLAVSAQLNAANPATSALGNPQLAGRTVTVSTNTVLLFTAHDGIGNAGSTPLVRVVVRNGTLSSSNCLTTLGPVTLDGGTLLADKGTPVGTRGAFDLNGTISVTGDTMSVLLSANGPDAIFRLNNTGSFATTFDVAAGLAPTNLLVAGELGNNWSGQGTTLVKTGNGTMVLAAANSYSGGTTLSAGTLLVNGSIHAAGSVTVTGGTLGGTGVVGRTTVLVGGTLAPGDGGAVGTLTVNGDLTMGDGAIYAWQAGDLAAVSGLLVLPGRVTVNVSMSGVNGVEGLPLFTCGGVIGGTNAASWRLVGAPGNTYVVVEPDRVVLRSGVGTVLTVR
jgi:fibronectin-binding autotransporter adhesin